MNSRVGAVSLMVVVALTIALAEAAPRRPHGTRSLSDAEAELRNAGGEVVQHVSSPMNGVVDLSTDYFYRYLKPIRFRHGRERYWLVLFYAQWCGAACDEYYIPLRDLATRLHTKDDAVERAQMEEKQQMRVRLVNRGKLSLGKHDATLDDGIPAAHGVRDRAYPALVLFDKSDERKVTHYNRDRSSLDELVTFIKEHTNGEVDLTL